MRISDWSSDVCSSDLFSCGERVDDRLELRATQNFVIEHPLRKLRPITGRWQGDSGHGGGFDQRAGMLGGVVKLDALTAPWHVERRSIIGSGDRVRSEEHTSELQSLMRISSAVFCLKKKTMTYPQSQNGGYR